EGGSDGSVALRVTSVYRPALDVALGCQSKSRLSVAFAQHLLSHIFPDCGPMFETVPGPAAHQPDVRPIGMAVDQKIAARRVLVLADPRFGERCVAQIGKPFGKESAGFFDAGVADAPVACVGIERCAVPVESQLESAPLQVGNSVGPAGIAKVEPSREV